MIRKYMNKEGAGIEYTHEDIKQIAGGDDGFCFRGPEEQDPLGQLFLDIQNVNFGSGVIFDASVQGNTVIPNGESVKTADNSQ